MKKLALILLLSGSSLFASDSKRLLALGGLTGMTLYVSAKLVSLFSDKKVVIEDTPEGVTIDDVPYEELVNLRKKLRKLKGKLVLAENRNRLAEKKLRELLAGKKAA
jgi:hypothetical protein